MTREQKLALIVGFSLVLLVGVLISDHLSRARQARIASVGSGEAPAPSLSQGPSNDPLRALDTALNSPAPAASQAPAAPLAAGPMPPVQESNPGAASPTVAQGSPHGARDSGDDTALKSAVEKAGGMIVLGKNGQPDVIQLPDMPGAAKSTTITTSPASAAPRTSPMFGYPAPARTLATNEQIKTHAVQKGETLFQITAKYYGTGHLWRELAKFNGVANKDGVVRVGSRLRIPSRDVLLGRPAPVETAAGAPPGTPAEKMIPARRKDLPAVKPEIRLATYTVKKGETLGQISKKVLGSSKRWQELAEFNKLQDEDSIPAGTVLKVPPLRG